MQKGWVTCSRTRPNSSSYCDANDIIMVVKSRAYYVQVLYHLVYPQVNSSPHFKMINRAQRLSNLRKDIAGSWYIVVFWLLMLFRILEIDKFRVGKASFYIQKLMAYVFLTICLVFPRLGSIISAKILGSPSYNASCLYFLLPLTFCDAFSGWGPTPSCSCSLPGAQGCSLTSLLLLQCHHVWPEGSDQECRHVWGHATRCRWLCHAGYGEVQHREGHCCLYQEGLLGELWLVVGIAHLCPREGWSWEHRKVGTLHADRTLGTCRAGKLGNESYFLKHSPKVFLIGTVLGCVFVYR